MREGSCAASRRNFGIFASLQEKEITRYLFFLWNALYDNSPSIYRNFSQKKAKNNQQMEEMKEIELNLRDFLFNSEEFV